jgi:hypothetical protein
MSDLSLSTPMVLRRRHKGSVLPSISGKKVPEGMLLFHGSDNWITVSVALFALAIVVFETVKFLEREGASSPLWYLALELAVIGLVLLPLFGLYVRRLWRAQNFGSAQLLVQPWPLRLGAKVTLNFRHVRRRRTPVDGVEAWIEWGEMTELNGDGRTTDWLKCGRIELDPAGVRVADKEIVGEWRSRIPTDLPPSFVVSDNGVGWFVSVVTICDKIRTAPSVFRLLVLPEIDT